MHILARLVMGYFKRGLKLADVHYSCRYPLTVRSGAFIALTRFRRVSCAGRNQVFLSCLLGKLYRKHPRRTRAFSRAFQALSSLIFSVQCFHCSDCTVPFPASFGLIPSLSLSHLLLSSIWLSSFLSFQLLSFGDLWDFTSFAIL